MAFTIYEDWWSPLAEQLGGDGRLKEVSPGDQPDLSPGDPSSHPRVDQAGKVATAMIKQALLQQYTAESLDLYDATADDAADLRRHAKNLALYALTQFGGAHSDDIDLANTDALGWLKNTREGQLTIVGLTRTGAGATGGGVSYKTRVSTLDSSNIEFAIRNRSI